MFTGLIGFFSLLIFILTIVTVLFALLTLGDIVVSIIREAASPSKEELQQEYLEACYRMGVAPSEGVVPTKDVTGRKKNK